MHSNCSGAHSYFVADVAVVEDEGTVNVIALCTSCGHSIMQSHKVTGKVKLEKRKID